MGFHLGANRGTSAQATSVAEPDSSPRRPSRDLIEVSSLGLAAVVRVVRIGACRRPCEPDGDTAEPGARPVVRCRPGRHVRRRGRAAAIGRATRRPRLDGPRGPGCPPLPGQPGDLGRGSHRSSHPGSHGAAPLHGGGGRVAGRHRAATPVHRRRHPGLLDDVRPGCADAAAHLGHHLPLPRSRAHAGLRGDRTFDSGHGGTPGHHPAGRHLRLGRHRRGRGRHRCCL